jgi:hypothetical protein
LSARPFDEAGAVGGRAVSTPSTKALTASELAWIVLLPCALAVLVLVLALGPPLGRWLFAPRGVDELWPNLIVEGVVRPEPTEHARYVLSLLGPALVAAATLVLARRRVTLGLATASMLATAGKVALVAFAAAAVVYQRSVLYDTSATGTPFIRSYFSVATLAVSVAFALLAAMALRRRVLIARVAHVARERTATRVVGLGLALLFVVVWLLSAFNTDASLAGTNRNIWWNVPFWADESFAILNGQAPLVDFHAQYGQLWAYLGAAALKAFGSSFTVYGTTMLAGTAAAMLAVYATLRRLTGSSLLALALFLPFVATSFFMIEGPPESRYGPAGLFSLFPIRYAGPYALLWLVVRRVERRPPSPPVALFVAAGLVAINNGEFGGVAFGASLLALAAAEPVRSIAQLVRLLGSALAGLAGAVAIVAALTLAVAGELPDFGMLAIFPRIFGIEGVWLLPMPSFGMHLAIYATLGAAVVVAAVRVAGDDDDARLTAALAWAGAFGLGAGAYFVGRSHPHVLIALFSVWSLALALLVVVTVRAVLATPRRRPSGVELLVLAGFGLAVCSLAQTPTPWGQLHRITHAPPIPGADTPPRDMRQAVAELTVRGEPVALLVREGHRIAFDLGIVDVTPYTNMEPMVTVAQWRETVRALRRAGGTTLLVPREWLQAEEAAWLRRAGYEPRGEQAGVGLVEFVARPS